MSIFEYNKEEEMKKSGPTNSVLEKMREKRKERQKMCFRKNMRRKVFLPM